MEAEIDGFCHVWYDGIVGQHGSCGIYSGLQAGMAEILSVIQGRFFYGFGM